MKFKNDPEAAQILALGGYFDELQSESAKWGALIMLATGFIVENIKEENHKDYIEHLRDDIEANIEALKKFASNELAGVKTQGNA